MEHHQENLPEKQLKVKLEQVRSVVKPLQRQVLEGQSMVNVPSGTELMNKKGEWGQNLPPKFTVEDYRDGVGPRKGKA